jgi:serine/threonine-protein kinase RsbT
VTESSGIRGGPRHVIEFAIHEKDFLMAGESASKTKKALQQLGLKAEVVKNTAIIVYEAAMNVVIHASHGQLKIVIVPEEVYILTEDVGPGIPDIELAMQEGYSTAPHEIREMGFGAGMGLPNIKRCSDDLKIRTEPGVGTVLEARIYLRQKEEVHREGV